MYKTTVLEEPETTESVPEHQITSDGFIESFSEGLESATVDQRRQMREMLERADREEAQRLRDLADEVVRVAREALDEATARAAELGAQAEALDGDVRPKVDTGIRRPASPVESMIDQACGVTEADYREAASKPQRKRRLKEDNDPTNPNRGRKPRAEKPAKPARKRGKRVMAPKAIKSTKGKAPKTDAQNARAAQFEADKTLVLKILAKGALPCATIGEKAGWNQPAAARFLKKLVEVGAVNKLGDKRATRYEAA